jgi:hypothetical protein
MIGVVSYLPSDLMLRLKRFAASSKQIEWFNTLFTNVKINVVAQAYNDSECVYKDVEYIRFENGIGAGKARNVLLEKFYNSDHDWLLLCDDDTIIDDKYDYQKFVFEILSNNKKFDGIDAVSAIEPEYHPYKKLNFQDKANLTHFKFEPRELNSGSATSFIRNIKKVYGKEIYYPNIDASKGEGREDMAFLFEWLKAGLTWYNMDTMIRKSLCFDKSSIFGTDTKARDKILMHDLDVMCELYKEDGLYRNEKGKINWKVFNDKYNKSKKVLYVPRNEPIEFAENVIPKEKVFGKTLF